MKEPASTLTSKEPSRSSSHWQFIGASVRGSSHEKTGLPCQDVFLAATPSNGALVAAVADGAGSASLSDIGAGVAARVAVGELCRFVVETNMSHNSNGLEAAIFDAMAVARLAVEEEAARRNAEVREFASTLLLAIATPSFVVAAQIGDGGIVVRDTQGEIRGLTVPEPSEYINEVCFLISPDALSHVQFQTWQGDTAQIAMFSDGLQLLCLKMPEAEPFDGFFVPIFEFAQKTPSAESGQLTLSEFLVSERVRASTDDDITLLLATLSDTA